MWLHFLVPSAWAFCGTYVSSGEAVLNRQSRMAVARAEDAITLTLENDASGVVGDFGLLIPVPQDFDSDNVRLAPPDLMDRFDLYSAPRLVSYTCDDLYGLSESSQGVSSHVAAATPSTVSSGCGGSDNAWFEGSDDQGFDSGYTTFTLRDTGTVQVVDEFELAEYDATVVSAAEGAGLTDWLTTNGFVVPAGTASLLDEYIAGGSTFLALTVASDEISEDGWLTPLQIGYRGESISLPIRLGATASAGVQDLLLFVLSDGGRVGVANEPEVSVAGDCRVDTDAEGFSGWYEAKFEEASGLPALPAQLEGRTGFAWTTEYFWRDGVCDPCTLGDGLDYHDLQAAGFESSWNVDFTRLHLRYTPDAVTSDLVLYDSGIREKTQQRYILDNWEITREFDSCDEGGLEGPTCYSAEYTLRKEEESPSTAPPSGCGAAVSILLLPALAGLRRRR